MSEKSLIQPELAEAITSVVNELATELDLHYEDSDIVATGPTIAQMTVLVEMLVASGYPTPEEYTHILGRFQRSVN